jgi:hypothetical protein
LSDEIQEFRLEARDSRRWPWLVFGTLGGITPHTNMKTQTSTSKSEHFAKWQAVHKQLLQDDAQYRKRHTSFLITIACLSCVILPFYLPFFGVRLFGPMADISIIVCVAVMIVCLAFRQLLFQNQRIQSYLESCHDA